MDNANQAVTTGVSSTTSSTSSNCIANENATENAGSNPPATSNGKILAVLKVGGCVALFKTQALFCRGDFLDNVTQVGADVPAAGGRQQVVDFVRCISASASMVTPSADTTVSNGVYVPGGIANGDVKSAVSTTPLADFLMQLEEYTPTVGLCLYKIQSCCQKGHSFYS